MSFAENESTWFLGSYIGVFISTDKGTSWGLRNRGFTDTEVISLAIKGNKIFAGTRDGIFVSTNNGDSWTANNPIIFTGFSVNYLLIKDSTIIACTDYGMYYSGDLGVRWTKKIEILGLNMYVISLATDGNIIIGGTLNLNKVYISNDVGINWKKINSGIVCKKVDLIKTNGDTVYACKRFEGGMDDRGGLFVSTNGGTNWKQVLVQYQNESISAIAPKDDTLLVQTSEGSFISYDNGIIWKSLYGKNSNIISNKDYFFSLIQDGRNYFVSRMYGKSYSWEKMKGLIKDYYGNYRQFAVSDNIIVVGMDRNIWISTDFGDSWENKKTYIWYNSSNSLSVYKDKIFIVNSDTVGFIDFSSDRGNSWKNITKYTNYRSFDKLITNGKYIMALGTNKLFKRVIIVSTNNGDTWKEIQSGLPSNYYILTMAVNNNYFYVSGYEGFFRARIDELISVDENKIYSKHKIDISPNPAFDFIEISDYGLGITTVEIFNAYGQTVVERRTVPLPQNELSIHIDISSLQSGIYYCCVSAGAQRITKSFVVLR